MFALVIRELYNSFNAVVLFVNGLDVRLLCIRNVFVYRTAYAAKLAVMCHALSDRLGKVCYTCKRALRSLLSFIQHVFLSPLEVCLQVKCLFFNVMFACRS